MNSKIQTVFCFTFISLAMLIFSGCARAPRPVTKYIDPQWNPKGSNVIVVVSNPLVDNQEDLADDLPEYSKDISPWFSEKFKKYFKAYTGIEPTVIFVPEETFKKDSVMLGTNKIVVPNMAELPDASLVLCLSSVRTMRTQMITETIAPGGSQGMQSASVTGVGMGMTYGVVKNYLHFEGLYAYYDSSTKKRVSYGVVLSDARFSYVLSSSDWENNIKQMVGNLIKGTPLRK